MARLKTSIIFALLALLCLGCSKFDQSMDKAKKYMINEDYEKAISELRIANIENPTNKNAIALLKTAQDQLKLQIEKNKKDKFRAESDKILLFLKEQIMTIDTGNISINEAKTLIAEANENKIKSNELFREYEVINENYSNAAYLLLQSSDEAVFLLENLVENIVEPLPSWEPGTSRYDRLRVVQSSNDSRIKASINQRNLESKLSEFNNIYVQIMRSED